MCVLFSANEHTNCDQSQCFSQQKKKAKTKIWYLKFICVNVNIKGEQTKYTYKNTHMYEQI